MKAVMPSIALVFAILAIAVTAGPLLSQPAGSMCSIDPAVSSCQLSHTVTARMPVMKDERISWRTVNAPGFEQAPFLDVSSSTPAFIMEGSRLLAVLTLASVRTSGEVRHSRSWFFRLRISDFSRGLLTLVAP